MKVKKSITLLALVLSGSTLLPGSALGSPRFSRSEEEWAALQDNTLVFSEIPGLIEEYNATALANQAALAKFKNEYGRTNEEVAEHYRDSAQKIMDNLEEPDPSSPTYVSGMASLATARATAQNLLSNVDSALEDSEITALQYEKIEKTLTQTAQTNMITRQSSLLARDKAQTDLELAGINLRTAQARLQAGAGTQAEVLSAQAAVQTADNTRAAAEAAAKTAEKKLQVMTGWDYNGTPVFGALPQPEENAARALDPAKDLEKAMANSYDIRINQKKRQNARSEGDQKTLDTSLAAQRSKVSSALVTAKQGVTAALEALESARATGGVQETALSILRQKYALGLASRAEMDAEEVKAKAAGIAIEQAKLNLLQAMLNYDWILRGLGGS